MRSTNSPSGRQPSFIERARREQLISCAVTSLAEDGYAATSIASVAGRAGIAKSVVLYYFGSKSGLLEAVAETVFAQAAAFLESAARPTDGSRERLLGYVRQCTLYADEHRSHTAALTEIFANLRTTDGALRYGAAENAPMIDFVTDLLRRGQEDGSFRSFDPRLMAISIRSAIDALPALFAAHPELTGTSQADHLAALFDHATRADGAAGRDGAPG